MGDKTDRERIIDLECRVGKFESELQTLRSGVVLVVKKKAGRKPLVNIKEIRAAERRKIKAKETPFGRRTRPFKNKKEVIE